MKPKFIKIFLLLQFCIPSIHAGNTIETPDTTIILEEVSVTSRASGTRKLRGSALNGELITAGELTRAACCNLGESFTTNPSVDVSYNDAATGARQIKLLGLQVRTCRCSLKTYRISEGRHSPTVSGISPDHGYNPSRYPKGQVQ